MYITAETITVKDVSRIRTSVRLAAVMPIDRPVGRDEKKEVSLFRLLKGLFTHYHQHLFLLEWIQSEVLL